MTYEVTVYDGEEKQTIPMDKNVSPGSWIPLEDGKMVFVIAVSYISRP